MLSGRLARATRGPCKERAKTLVEMVDWVRPYFGQAVICDEEAADEIFDAGHRADAAANCSSLRGLPGFSKQQWEEHFKQLVEEEGMKMGQLAQPVRVALTGRTASPGLFDVMEVLGRDGRCFGSARGLNGPRGHKKVLSSISADLDETEAVYYCWASVGGSSSGRTSVSGSDYLGSIPSPPANTFPPFESRSFPRPYRAGGSSSGRTPVFGAGYLGSIPSPPATILFPTSSFIRRRAVDRWPSSSQAELERIWALSRPATAQCPRSIH